MITFIDRPCGFGKTTEMLNGLKDDELYLIVVPTLGEVDRCLENKPKNVRLTTPSEEHGSKSRELERLIKAKENVVCTHSLYHLNSDFYKEGHLDDYNIIIDEVLDVVKTIDGPKPKSWEEFYVDDGYATVDEKGQVHTTAKWDERRLFVDDTLNNEIYDKANTGQLFVYNHSFFVWGVSPYLLNSGKTCTVMSFRIEGSLMQLYLDRIGIPYEIQKYQDEEQAMRESFRDLATVTHVELGVDMSYSKQLKSLKKGGQHVASKLRKIKERDKSIDKDTKVLLTCAKGLWHGNGWSEGESKATGVWAKGSRLAEQAVWIANTTRGTNDYKEIGHAIYLYDQYLNPAVKRWLGATNEQQNQYALSELLQWLYRTRLRERKTCTIYIGSKRMKDLLDKWLAGDL